MEATTKQTAIRYDLVVLFAVTLFVAICYSLSMPHYLPTSKIEEGTVVVRNDSITTIIIPDRR